MTTSATTGGTPSPTTGTGAAEAGPFPSAWDEPSGPETVLFAPDEVVRAVLMHGTDVAGAKGRIAAICRDAALGPDGREAKIRLEYDGAVVKGGPDDVFAAFDAASTPGSIRVIWQDKPWQATPGLRQAYVSFGHAARELTDLVLGGNYGETGAAAVQPPAMDAAGPVPAEMPAPANLPAPNYQYPADHVFAGGPKAICRHNLAAIRLLKELESDRRPAAAGGEQAILAGYAGWGGTPQVFDEGNMGWAAEREELKRLLTGHEYGNARASVNTAFFTPIWLARQVNGLLARAGMDNGGMKILEPSMGTGRFFGAGNLQNARMYGVEPDAVSAAIARHLYQDADIRVTGIENAGFKNDYFNAVIGNVPFGDYRVFDPDYRHLKLQIHDYFMVKTLDLAAPGGIVALITAKGTMDKRDMTARREMAKRAELIGAIRLPDNAFGESAGTEVTADVLVLRKNNPSAGKTGDPNPGWLYIGATAGGVPVNSYFTGRPEMLLGEMRFKEGRFGAGSRYTACVDTGRPDAFKTDFIDRIQRLDIGNMSRARQATPAQISIPAHGRPAESGPEHLEDKWHRDSYVIRNGRVCLAAFDKIEQEFVYETPLRITSEGKERELNEKEMGILKELVHISHALKRVYDVQLGGCTADELGEAQEELEGLYDEFKRNHGHITRHAALLELDKNKGIILALEVPVPGRKDEYAKADIFTKHTIRPAVPVTSAATAVEALHISLNTHGRVDIPYMLSLYTPGGMDDGSAAAEKAAALAAELHGVIYRESTDNITSPDDFYAGRWVTADEFLSGNVLLKLEEAQNRLAGVRGASEIEMTLRKMLEHNIAALEQVQPERIEAGDIAVKLGTPWITVHDYEDFMYELLDTPYHRRRGSYSRHGGEIKIEYNEINTGYHIANKSRDIYNRSANREYGTNRRNAYEIIEESLNLRDVKIYDTVLGDDGREKRVLNGKETLFAREKQEVIREKFRDWIFREPNRRARYVEYYNRTFNASRTRVFDGAYLTFPGMNAEIELMPHQRAAIARILSGRNTLLAHCVGAGKSFEMIAACMEAKRIGVFHKPAIIVPKPIVNQMAAEFMRLYPTANILAATPRDFEKNHRRRFTARIAAGDYDCIIMSHTQFGKIGISKGRQTALIEKQLDEQRTVLETAKYSSSRLTVKQMETAIKKTEGRLKELLASGGAKDDALDFEELGIDCIMVDESHNFKKIDLFSKIGNNVAGIARAGSGRSFDLYAKCEYLNGLNNNKGIVFATGTPITNTMCEMYVIQQYLQKHRLKEMGIDHFDSWAANFGEITTALELKVEGNGYQPRTRFSRFVNLPELTSLFSEVADIQTAGMITGLDLPAVRDGRPAVISVEPDGHTRAFIDRLAMRAELLRGNPLPFLADLAEVEIPANDNFLKITGEARALGIDARLIRPDAPANPAGKLAAAADNIRAEYLKAEEAGIIGTQLVFSDIGVPGPGKGFDVYNALKDALVGRGIPAGEIAFIHDAETDKKREDLFAQMRTGEKRVLIGSTDKCGTGVNVQDHLVALHHIDCPWLPASIEQREGRAIRQGNVNPEVAIYRYVTKGTFDAYNWGILENKQKFIGQAISGKPMARAAADIDETALTYAEIKAIATGNPAIKEKMELDNEMQRLRLLKAAHENNKTALQNEITVILPRKIAGAAQQIECLEADIATLAANAADNRGFAIEIGGNIHDERAAAGAALMAAMGKCQLGAETALGSYMGFAVSAHRNYMGEDTVILTGRLAHKTGLGASHVGNITRLENLAKSLGERLEEKKEQLAAFKSDLEKSAGELEKPFAHADEFETKRRRQTELGLMLEFNIDAEMEVDGDVAIPGNGVSTRAADENIEPVVAEDEEI